MELDPKICSRARMARDARFDGRFYIGVRTTGVYCRPVCPVAPPKEKNVTYYPTAAAAGEAGFRPCLRCRPEAAPGAPAWAGSSTTVSRGLRLIGSGALDQGDVEDLGDRLGVGERHLRRLFVQHLGASPVAVAQTRRLHFAKKLIDETELSMAEIALGSGYGSIRRFNAAFRSSYGRTPSELRRARRGKSLQALADQSAITIRLQYRSPLDWESLLEFLAGRAIPGVECVTPDSYARTIALDGSTGSIEVRRNGSADGLLVSAGFPEPRALFTIVERVRRIFDLGADPECIADHLGQDKRLRASVRKHAGLRVPGAWDGFELAVRAVLGQQISVKGASTIAGRLVSRHGTRVSDGEDAAPRYVFPSADTLADADLAGLGLTRGREQTLRNLARAVAAGDVSFDGALDLEQIVATLTSVPGIGEWTAHYVAMRALGEPDAFPASDLALLRAAAGAGEKLTPARLKALAEPWRPWRAYAAMHLWKQYGADLKTKPARAKKTPQARGQRS